MHQLTRRIRVYPTNKNDEHIANNEYLSAARAIKMHNIAFGVRQFDLAVQAGVMEAHSRIFDVWKTCVFGGIEQMQRYSTGGEFDRAREVVFGITPNHALRNLMTAAEAGDLYAMGWLALVYDGVVMDCKNSQLAERWYRSAVQKGCVHSAFNLLNGINEGVFISHSALELTSLTGLIMDCWEQLPEFLRYHNRRILY